MTRRSPIVFLAVSLALAGCTAGPVALPGVDQPNEHPTSGMPPGVSDGQLANSSALVHAHETSLNDTGYAARLTRAVAGREVARYDMVVASGRSHYTLSGNRTTEEETTVEMDFWANASHRMARYRAGGESHFDVSQRGSDPFNPLAVVGHTLHSGTFTVANETTEARYTVLTAQGLDQDSAGDSRFPDAASLSARATVDETGRVHNLTVTVTRRSVETTYTFALLRTGVESVERPAWTTDVPADTSLNPQLSIDVQNGTILTVRNHGRDSVPANATLILTTDNTTYRASFDAPLKPGELQYAAIATGNGTLQLTSASPDSSEAMTLTSPISVTIETASGVTLHSGGIGWERTGDSESSGSGRSPN